MATIALAVAGAVAAAGSVASTATQASGGKGGGGSAPRRPTAPLWENIFNRGTADILGNERAVYDDAMAQANFMDDFTYRTLGYEPIYDQEQDANIAQLSQTYNAIHDKVLAAEAKKAAVHSLPKMKGKQRAKKLAKREVNRLLRQEEVAREALSSAQQLPRRIVGLRPIEPDVGAPGRDARGVSQLAPLPDPTSSKDGLYAAALDLELEHLSAALLGKEPIDPTLIRTLDEEEKQLRNSLIRNLGPDYETSTPGIEALANMRKRRAEAIATYNTNAISTYASLSQQRAQSLSALRGERIKQEAIPQQLRIASLLAASQIASTNIDYLAERRYERSAQGEADLASFTAEQNARTARDARRAQQAASIQQLTGMIAGGIYGAATA